MSKILVIGASGTVGSALVQQLRDGGHDVLRATSAATPASDQVHLDLVSGSGLQEALDGVERAFLLAPPGHVNQHELLIPVIDQAHKAGLRKLVLMSAMGANADPSSPLRRAELHLEQSPLAWTILRPNWFMQNFNSFWLAGILEQGAILLPTGTARGSFIDARDIAAVAAQVLQRSEFDGQDFDLTGAEALDHDQVAALLSAASGRSIRYQDISEDAMRGRLLQAGLPAPYAEFLLLILGYFKAGYAERITPAVPTILGRPPISLAQYARDYRQAWQAP